MVTQHVHEVVICLRTRYDDIWTALFQHCGDAELTIEEYSAYCLPLLMRSKCWFSGVSSNAYTVH